jgi:hypothetical protein
MRDDKYITTSKEREQIYISWSDDISNNLYESWI